MRDQRHNLPFNLRPGRRLGVTVCLALMACGLSGAAHAMIINQGEYDAGIVVVEGETQQPNQKVTLDDRFTAWSDDIGRFTFRVRYLPSDCMVQLEAGRDVRPVYLVNCAQVNRSTRTPATEAPERPRREKATRATDLPSGPLHLRIVRQPCERNNECKVICRTDEIAINAFCPDGNPRLLSEQSVSCGAASTTSIVAYCVTGGDRIAER